MGFRTQAQVDRLRLPEGKLDLYVWDDECTGLSVRLQGKARRWVVWYQANGARRRMTLGNLAGLSLRDARTKAGRIVGDARDGKDPLAARASAKAKPADTLGMLVKIYLERRAKPRQRPRSYAETKRHLQKHWLALHDRSLASLTRRDVASRLEEIVNDHGPIAANRARAALSGAFSWAMRVGLIEHNPVLNTERPSEEVERDRVLEPAELALIWRACDGAGDFGTILRLLAMTGQRREEVAAMRWSELDVDNSLWSLPPQRTKNRRAHEIPLTPQAMALLPKKREGRELLFGRGKKGGFSGFSQAKARLDERIAKLRAREAGHDPETVDLEKWALPGWRLHDFRRTAKTEMLELGVDPHIADACLNHTTGHRDGVNAHYNFARYREPKRVALQRWADWLQAAVEGREPASNLVPLAS
jgi:integrase